MKRARILYETDIKNHDYNSNNIKFGVYGVFDTNDVKWKYFLISFYYRGKEISTSPDLCKVVDLSPWNVDSNCREIDSVESGITFIQEYKIKWETGSNDVKSKIRDEKISNILDK